MDYKNWLAMSRVKAQLFAEDISWRGVAGTFMEVFTGSGREKWLTELMH